VNGGEGYVGLQFLIGGQVHYGWASFSITPPNQLFAGYNEVLTGYAHNTIADATILAGQGTVPEPGTLGLLALGSLGLAFWRRRGQV
jgi:hypothetical protein